MFWVRESYCAVLGVLGFVTVVRLARPGLRLGLVPMGIPVAVIAMWVLAGVTLVKASPQNRAQLILGHTAGVCPFLIVLVAARSAARSAAAALVARSPLASQGSLKLSADGSWLFAVNAGSGSVVGFNFNHGKLVWIPNSLRLLSGNAVASGSVAFSPDGQFLIVTEKATNNLDVFKVLSDGSLSQATTAVFRQRRA
jgi:hypothetical protein